jgi:hypothetical protein
MVAPRATLPDAIFLRSKHARNLSRSLGGKPKPIGFGRLSSGRY